MIEKIDLIDGLKAVGECKYAVLHDAEKQLGLVFPGEYKEYVSVYGSISFNNTVWTGLGIDGENNVVEATIKERKSNDFFPDDMFILDNYHVHNRKIAANEKGEVYLVDGEEIGKLCDNISEYLDMCLIEVS